MTDRAVSPQAFIKGLLVLVLLGAGIRVAHIVSQTRNLPFIKFPILDAALYHDWAVALADGSWSGTAPFYHAPGYALVLSSLYGMIGASPLAAAVVQSVVGLGTLVLTVLLGQRLAGPREGLLAGALLLFTGSLYFFETKLLGTTWAVFLAVLTVYLSAVAEDLYRSEGGRRAQVMMGVAGVSAGMLAVIRANLLLLPVLFGLVLLYRAFRSRRFSRGAPVLYLIGVTLAILPVFAYNLSGGAFVPVATNGGFNFYSGNARGATGVYTDIPGISGAIALQEAEADSLVMADQGEVLGAAAESQYWFRRGLDEIKADPAGRFGLLLKKGWLLVNRQEETVNGTLAVESARIPVLRVLALPFNVLVGFALVGWVLAMGWLGTGPGRAGSMAAGYALLVAILVTGVMFFVMTRLRLPAAPILAILAAHAVVRGWELRQTHRRQVLALGVAGVVFIAATWVSPLGAARNPGWEASLFSQAAARMSKEGNAQLAAQAYEIAIEIQPGSVEALRGRAEVALKAGDVPMAVRMMERAVAVAPDDFSVQNNLGILYFTAGRREDCLATMALASKLNPSSGSPMLYQGHVYRQLREFAPAQLAYRTALERDPRLRGAYVSLIEIALGAGLVEDARLWLNRATDNRVSLPSSLTQQVP